MRLLIDTSGVQFRVSGAAKPKPDFKDKERQATTRDGELIWTVRLDAIDHDRETKETIWVEVAGDQPKLTLGLRLMRGQRRSGGSRLEVWMYPAAACCYRSTSQPRRCPRRMTPAGPASASTRSAGR
jgi:hypothetical protein